ncbi:tRNA dihydrouridine synthase DusB [bacterium]|nr:MAG: tRNA dihydrouridine synthase DusB [bacterium]
MIETSLKLGNISISPPLILAPMAGITNGPFRKVCRAGGAGLVYSEMISAKALSFNDRRTRDMGTFLEEEHPVAAQIFGREPGEMARAAAYLEDAGADIIDINMGCPVKKVLKSGSGVQLMREPDLAASIARAVVNAVKIPVTIKVRAGWSTMEMNYISLCTALEAEGIDAVILHPRTRTQGFSGRASWECIGWLKEALSIPVIGSGDVNNTDSAMEIFRVTGCDAVMIGRGALGKPWIFREISREMDLTNGDVTTDLCKDLMADHITLLLEHFPGKRSVGQLRKHLAWYTKGYPNGSSFRREINSLDSSEEIVDLAEEFLGLDQRTEVRD